jgi:serine/tyrosine/threonine adenylyltransferase
VPFIARVDDRFLAGMPRKLGLSSAREGDPDLVRRLLTLMRHSQADFTLTFRRLALVAENPVEDAGLREPFEQRSGLDGWLRNWPERLASDPQTASERTASMCSVSGHHSAQSSCPSRARGGRNGDYRLFRKLLEILQRPYDGQVEVSAYSQPPQSSERVLQN